MEDGGWSATEKVQDETDFIFLIFPWLVLWKPMRWVGEGEEKGRRTGWDLVWNRFDSELTLFRIIAVCG
jgi:hypothetical protein